MPHFLNLKWFYLPLYLMWFFPYPTYVSRRYSHKLELNHSLELETKYRRTFNIYPLGQSCFEYSDSDKHYFLLLLRDNLTSGPYIWTTQNNFIIKSLLVKNQNEITTFCLFVQSDGKEAYFLIAFFMWKQQHEIKNQTQTKRGEIKI